jgi:coenzyme PQQ precursor peptide PqqA
MHAIDADYAQKQLGDCARSPEIEPRQSYPNTEASRMRKLWSDLRRPVAWTRPKLREICIGMEINGYLAARM